MQSVRAAVSRVGHAAEPDRHEEGRHLVARHLVGGEARDDAAICVGE